MGDASAGKGAGKKGRDIRNGKRGDRTMTRRGKFWRQLAAATVLGVALAGMVAGKPPETPKAVLRVTGLGWWQNRDLRFSLERLLGAQLGETVEVDAIEDAAFLLVSALEQKGFLKPVIEIEFTPVSGAPQRFTFDTTLATPLPRPLAAKAVTFRVAKGVRYVVNEVQIEGLTAFPVKVARGYFRPEQALFVAGEARAYTPARLNRAVDALLDEFRQRGYAEAQVLAKEVRIDDRTGQVALTIAVVEGPRWDVAALRFEGAEASQVPVDLGAHFRHRPWSALWQQDVRARVRQLFWQRGFPDVTVTLAARTGVESACVKPVEVTATIAPGPHVTVGQVRFEGNVRTKESVLRRRVQAVAGGPLDPLKFEQARYELSRLGVFTAVDLRYEPADGEVRNPVFLLKEGRQWDASLLAGYGSYEQARAGVELRQLNLFGRAHQTRLELVQSMKGSRGEYTYTVPELFGASVDGTAKLFGLQRQEESFLRQEFGATVALKRPLPWFKIDASVGYTFQSLRNRDNVLGTSGVDPTTVDVGSIDLGLTSDRRDNPLRPRRGYRWFTQVEYASRYLGGQPDYQRLVAGAAFHTAWGSGRWIHLGVTHGVITTQGAGNDRLLPVNKRFYPGGESSIRGYGEGEAAPRGADGLFLGAKAYLLANLELEQALTTNWSVVVFTDALGATARLASYPFDEKLYSAGLGLRYHTLIGPVRLEYGRNLNPRPGDPSGTLHFSVGLPF
jgi:outer membrane protein assembly complex protein YaeT